MQANKAHNKQVTDDRHGSHDTLKKSQQHSGMQANVRRSCRGNLEAGEAMELTLTVSYRRDCVVDQYCDRSILYSVADRNISHALGAVYTSNAARRGRQRDASHYRLDHGLYRCPRRATIKA